MEIKGFRALRFDGSAVGDVGSCISPPYDVIDPDMQQRLYDKNPHNVVRIIKGKTTEADSDSDNQYTRAATALSEWTETGSLVQDPVEGLYAYVQDFRVGDQECCRSGFVALGRIEEFGEGVKAHEKTLDGPKADRLKLTQATGAQFGQIFMLYDDPARVADKIIAEAASGEPLIDLTDEGDVRHRLFAIADADNIMAIVTMMADKHTVIADGHHRYETALNYYRLSQNPAAEYRMMTFVNMRNEGLVILPTHRLVANVEGFDIDKVIEKVGADFTVTEYAFSGDADKAAAKDKMFARLADEFAAEKNAFGIYAASGAFYAAVLSNAGAMDDYAPQMSTTAKELDVNILHSLILEKVMGIGDKQLASQSNLKYIKDIGDAIDRSIGMVDSGESQVVFFMNATRIAQVNDIAQAGEKMPQKSTFFHPKVFTGLVINKL